jgi:catechol 2,3-dioxygenase-like lactoylglutathione lyase family enzyme
MIRAVKFVSIPTRDQDRALEFYTRKLGFAVLSDQPFDDKQRWIELRIPGADTRLVLFTPPGWEERIGSFFNFAFVTDDIDATYAEFQARGVETLGPPQKAEWGSSLMFKDADGNQLLVSTK